MNSFNIHSLRRCVVALLLLIVSGVASAASLSAAERRALLDSIVRKYPVLTSHEERFKALYNIYDLSTDSLQRRNVLERLYKLATTHMHSSDAELEILMNVAQNEQHNAQLLDSIAVVLKSYTETPYQREATLIVDLLRASNRVRHNTLGVDSLSNMVRRYDRNSVRDPYKRVSLLFELSLALSRSTQGLLLTQYLDSLESAVLRLPLHTGTARRLIFEHISPYYTNYGLSERAVRIDKKLLNLIDSIRLVEYSHGRIYRDFDLMRYYNRQRLLANYEALSEREQEAIFNIMDELTEDPRIAEIDAAEGRTRIFRALAQDKWSEAIPLLLAKIHSNDTVYRRYYVDALIDAANHTNDRHALLEASIELNEMFRDELNRRSDERVREFQVLYDTYIQQGDDDNSDEEHRIERIRAIVLAVAVVLLVIMVMFMLYQNSKVRRLVAQRMQANERLTLERNELRTARDELIEARDQAKAADRKMTDFVNNISHEVRQPLATVVEYSKLIVDCIPESQSKYLDRFANVVELNARMVTRLVNDVLDVAALENDNMSISKTLTSVDELCRLAIDTISENSQPKPDVKLVYQPGPDISVNTDGQRVVQVLVNLLSNGVKFTDSGEVRLTYEYDEAARRLTFAVSDTGIGFPKSKVGEIFDRFFKLDRTRPGAGLGLYISRLISDLLDGSLSFDMEYHGGSRFIFSIPV
ncbi:MAG: HAMP domain-containing histidine kinase [Muribaculaceae bacterium]|nr:HAMP domain-containing histidine kinase [Muribaculaceae bacterium]